MKTFLKISLIILAFLCLAGIITGYMIFSPMAAVGTGYYAKMLCSSTFISGRTYESIMGEDLNIKQKYPIKTSIDKQKQSSEASLFGIFKTKAIFRPGLGCTLCVEGTDEIELKQQAMWTSGSPERTSFDLWPDGDRVSESLPDGIDGKKLTLAIDKAFEEKASGTLGTRAVVIVFDGRIIAERYAPGFTKDTPLIGWSMTKSVTNALVGILANQGKLNVMEKAPVPEWQKENDPRKEITIDNLMRMSSRLEFIEQYEDNITSDVNSMLFTKKCAASYAANKPLKDKPGTKWYYSSGTTNIIARIARDKSGLSQNEWFNFPRQELFNKIGMKSAVIEPDASGNFVGSSYSYATAHDWARFGLLYLKDGVWKGERILPEGWVKYSTTPTPNNAPNQAYGAHFWLNAANPKPWLDFIPEDMYLAHGYEGQVVMIIPSRNLVIVRLGLARGPSPEMYLAFVKDVLDVLPDNKIQDSRFKI